MRFAPPESLPPRAEGYAEVPHPERCRVLAAGAFDGLHLGHRAVIEAASALAAELKAESGVLRFHPHPARVLSPDTAPPLLCTEAQIQELLADLGIQLHLRLPFSREFSEMSAETFLEELFAGLPGLRGLVAGSNWRFGHRGAGDMTLLKKKAEARGIEVRVAGDVQWAGEKISSTRIREALLEGKLEEAEAMLGRHHVLSGIVRAGRKFGRKLGFPTANFIPEQALLPPPGVYAMRVRTPPGLYHGAGYITREPRLVEVHLLDFEGDLYTHPMAVELLWFERAARPIADPDVLRERITADVRNIRQKLTV
jgi:riboflavin kinase/FMN adenylyltransferase